MTSTAAHTAYCMNNAVCSVLEEVALSGVELVPVGEDTLAIPAWDTTVDALAIQWLAETTITCHCD